MHTKQNVYLKVQSLAHTNLLGTSGRYRIQVGMVDSYGTTLGFMELDAQAVFLLSTSEGQQKTGKRQLVSDHSHEHALKLINTECKHEQDIIHHEHKYREGYVDFVSTT